MKYLLFFIFFIFHLSINTVWAQQEKEIAEAYMKQGEYDKAVDIYKKIISNKDQARIVHNDFITALSKTKDFNYAEKFIKNQIKTNPDVIVYKADLAQLYEISGREEQGLKEFRTLISLAAANDNQVFELQNFFFRTNRLELAVDLLLHSRIAKNDPTRFDLQLARVYLYLDKKDKMLEEIFSYGFRNKNASYVQSVIQDNFKDEQEIQIIQKQLYQKIQADPNENYYVELLIWHLAQQQDFSRAFIQSRALDKRMKLGAAGVFDLAGQAFNAKDYKNAAKMYQYTMENYPQGELYPYARRWYIQSKEEIVKTTFPIDIAQINDLIIEYQKILDELGAGPKTTEVLRNMGLLQAFHLQQHDIAIETLNKAIGAAQNNQKFKDLCKLDLGDIYILKNQPWESTLLYMQVEKTQKEELLGEQAKLKNAKLQYYTGQFELSKEILDVLKKATTKEISNDALQLSLLIQDNTGLDTSELAMQEFASMDLLIFQNKYQESIDKLKDLFEKYKSHSLADEILWLKVNMELKINKITEAKKDLANILENYKYDILADDALFTLAKITQENDKDDQAAMALYRKLLNDYPGSIFASQARIKFRELRGDSIN